MGEWVKTVEQQTKQKVGVYTNTDYDFVFMIAPHNTLDRHTSKEIDQYIKEYIKSKQRCTIE